MNNDYWVCEKCQEIYYFDIISYCPKCEPERKPRYNMTLDEAIARMEKK
ncbi:hypothetical protein KAR91_40665 [Candidatus Pacearchaeota archaeon]|nr:hypothetical protein [Candidatus Pacearchaeota archaeon]